MLRARLFAALVLGGLAFAAVTRIAKILS